MRAHFGAIVFGMIVFLVVNAVLYDFPQQDGT